MYKCLSACNYLLLMFLFVCLFACFLVIYPLQMIVYVFIHTSIIEKYNINCYDIIVVWNKYISQ